MTTITSSSQLSINYLQLKTDWKNTLLTYSFLSLLMVLYAPVYADEALIKIDTQTDSEQNKQENAQQTKALEEKQTYSFLSNQLFTSKPSQTIKKEPVSTGDAVSVSLGLIIILVLIFSLAWFMKKMGYSNVSGQGQLKIISSLNLGQKEKIALIQVGKQQLLVGVTATQINTLHVLDEMIEESDIKQNAPKGDGGDGAFANKFSELLTSRRKAQTEQSK